jgi:hypothetical protein
MDSIVHRRVSGTPIPASLTPSTRPPSTPSPSTSPPSTSSRAREGRAREGRRAPAYPERSGPQPRPGCKPRPP